MQLELRRMPPHVGALPAHDEGQVTHQLDAELSHERARFFPLLQKGPLHVSDFQHRAAVRIACSLERPRRTIAFVRGPRVPPPPAMRSSQHGVEGEIVHPGAFAVQELCESLSTRCAVGPFALAKAYERGVQNARLEVADAVVVDAGCLAQLVQLSMTVIAQCLGDEHRIGVLDRFHVRIDGVETERRQRAVRARFARR